MLDDAAAAEDIDYKLCALDDLSFVDNGDHKFLKKMLLSPLYVPRSG
jgi:hypothetical protein